MELYTQESLERWVNSLAVKNDSLFSTWQEKTIFKRAESFKKQKQPFLMGLAQFPMLTNLISLSCWIR